MNTKIQEGRGEVALSYSASGPCQDTPFPVSSFYLALPEFPFSGLSSLATTDQAKRKGSNHGRRQN